MPKKLRDNIYGIMICLKCGEQRIIRESINDSLVRLSRRSVVPLTTLDGMDEIATCCKSPNYTWRDGDISVEKAIERRELKVKKAKEPNEKELEKLAPYFL